MAVYLGKNKVGMVKKFYGQDKLQWKCDNVKSLYYEFYNATVEDLYPALSNLDTSNVTNMAYMFYYCKQLKTLDLSNFDTTNVTSMQAMFQACNALTSVDLSSFNTANVTNMQNMFYECKALTEVDLSHFNVSKVTSMTYMFSQDSKLAKVNASGWEISPSMQSLMMFFNNCTSLNEVDLTGWDTSKVTNMSYMFQACRPLKVIKTLDLYSATSLSSMFNSCRDLETLILKNIRRALTIGSGTSYGTLINKDSLVNTIKELWDYSSGTTTYTLTMSTPSKELIANTYVKLVDVTDEMLAQDQYAGNKMPCIVCESTDEGAMLITSYANLKGWTIA